MFKPFLRNRTAMLIIGFFILITPWWTYNYFNQTAENQNSIFLYGFVYALIALFAGINGLFIAKKWGGWQSLIGKAIILFSLGILGEWFGQTVWSYYNLIAKVEVPFPSIADFGYFSIIPLYGLGMLFLAKAAGAKFGVRKSINKVVVVVAPVVMLTFVYFILLKDIPFDTSTPIATFLTFGSPIGEAIVFSIALATFQLSRGLLGGVMRRRLLFLLGVFFVRYITGVTFLYRFNHAQYYNGDVVDYMFTIYFTLMALGLNSLRVNSQIVTESTNNSEPEVDNGQ